MLLVEISLNPTLRSLIFMIVVIHYYTQLMYRNILNKVFKN